MRKGLVMDNNKSMRYSIGDRILFQHKDKLLNGYVIQMDPIQKIYQIVSQIPGLILINEDQVTKLDPRPTMVK